jgi:hypothetical protein
MAQRPRAVTYATAMDALHDAYLTLRELLAAPISQDTREPLVLLRDRLELIVARDNGRRRY